MNMRSDVARLELVLLHMFNYIGCDLDICQSKRTEQKFPCCASLKIQITNNRGVFPPPPPHNKSYLV